MTTTITPGPPGTMKFATTAYTGQVAGCLIRPSQSQADVETLSGVTTTYGPVKWTMTLTYVQDWTGGSLSAYLNTNAGSTVTFEFCPIANGTAPKASGSVVLRPPAFGGDVGRVAMDTIEMLIVGTPTFS